MKLLGLTASVGKDRPTPKLRFNLILDGLLDGGEADTSTHCSTIGNPSRRSWNLPPETGGMVARDRCRVRQSHCRDHEGMAAGSIQVGSAVCPRRYATIFHPRERRV